MINVSGYEINKINEIIKELELISFKQIISNRLSIHPTRIEDSGLQKIPLLKEA